MISIEQRIAARNVFRQGARSLLPLAVVALSTFVILFIGSLYNFLFTALEGSIIRTEGQVWITFHGSSPSADEAAALQSLPGVRVLAPRAAISGIVGFGDQSTIFSGVAEDPVKEREMRAYSPHGAQAQSANASESASPSAILGVLLAQGLGVKQGDWISGISGSHGFSAQVAGTTRTASPELDRYYLRIPFSAMGGIDWAIVNSLHLQLAPGVRVSDILPGIRGVLARYEPSDPGKSPRISTYLQSGGYVSSVRSIFRSNLTFIQVVIAITVFFAIATAFTMAIAERSRELGTIRTFGGSQAHLIGLFQWEAFFLACYGYLAGVVAALMAGAIVNSLGGLRMRPPPTVQQALHAGFLFDPRSALLAFLLSCAVSQLSAFAITRRLGRRSIVDELALNS